jgi:Nif-specific regulatory protein
VVEGEHELFRHCLDLASSKAPGPLLERALELLRESSGAGQGYIELRQLRTGRTGRWAAEAGLDADSLARVQSRISTTIVAAAIEAGRTIHTASAVLDARFGQHESVRRSQIEAVLCVPIAAEALSGVVYLQNFGEGGPFPGPVVERVEVLARYVGVLAGRLVELGARREDDEDLTRLRQQLKLPGVRGRSPALVATLRRVGAIASMRSNVLLLGPSGTGKSMFARILHDNSERASGPFIELNCAALPEALFESELFGAERGAHSGATNRRMPGKIEAAEGGTLFLDEVGELRLENQPKILHFLQSQAYYPLGATTPRQADVRVVSATNRDLESSVRAGEFREDLCFRLRGLVIRVPTLEERREDIVELARHFCEQTSERNGLPIMELSAAAASALEFGDWPGNIRELAHCCEAAVVDAHIEGVTRLELRHIQAATGKAGDAEASGETFQSAMAEFQRGFLARALSEQDWNVAATARALDVSRSHLNALIARFKLSRI